MSISGFGNIMPIHGAILRFIGWRLTRSGSSILEDERERLAEMRAGQMELVNETGADLGFDLEKWRELLMSAEEFGYCHPYAFDQVDREVQRAIADPRFARLLRLIENPADAG